MALVQVFKKQSQYVDKDGKDRTATNFFVDCGGILVPVEVKYFEDKETGRDDRYRERKVLLTAFAEMLPDKETSVNKKSTDKALPASQPIPAKEMDNIPF